jgi:hypothetical protein
MKSPALYAAGAYLVYPALAGAGGLLLAGAETPLEIASAAALLAGALALPGWLGFYCRRCGEKPLPKFLRLTVLPAAVAIALAARGDAGPARFAALLLLAASAVAFGLAWRFAGGERSIEAERRLLGDEKPDRAAKPGPSARAPAPPSAGPTPRP